MRRRGIYASYPIAYKERKPGEGIFTGSDGDDDMFILLREDEHIKDDSEIDDEEEDEEDNALWARICGFQG